MLEVQNLPRADRRGISQGLQDHAVTLRPLSQGLQLLLCRLRSFNVEAKADVLEPDRHLLGDAQRASKVQVPLHLHFDALRLDFHGLGDHLASDLRASR
jgi:hypothetical protein